MKKSLLSFIIPLAVITLAVVAVAPAPVDAQVPPIYGSFSVSSFVPPYSATTTGGITINSLMGFSVAATGTDITLLRIKIDLGSDVRIVGNGSTIFITRKGGELLFSQIVNPNTVVQVGNDYILSVPMNINLLQNTSSAFVIGINTTSIIPNVSIPVDSISGRDVSGVVSFGPSQTLYPTGSNSCYNFSQNFGIGSSGPDVVALQTWLIGHGFDIPAISGGLTPKGYYGLYTADAVSRYQISSGLLSTGYFGLQTRQKINYSCNVASGQIVTSLNANSPLNRLVQISSSSETKDVVLARFDLKSENNDSTLHILKIYINTNGVSVNSLFNRIKILAAGQTISANTVSTTGNDTVASSTVSFTNMSIPLQRDTYTTVTVLADVAQPVPVGALDGTSASTTIKSNNTNIFAIDSSYNTVPVVSNSITSSNTTFTSGTVSVISNLNAYLGPSIISNYEIVAYPMRFIFTVNANAGAVYLSSDPAAMLTTTGYGFATLPVLTLLTATPSNLSGDSTGYYIVPQGSSRDFMLAGTIKKTDATPGTGVAQRMFNISGIYYGNTATNLRANSITQGLAALSLTPTIGSPNAPTMQTTTYTAPYINEAPTAPLPPAPTVSLSVNPSTVTVGQVATIYWSSTNSTSCTGTGFTPVTTSGTQGIKFTAPMTVSLSITCTGTGGSKTAYATLKVISSSVPPAETTKPTPSTLSSSIWDAIREWYSSQQ